MRIAMPFVRHAARVVVIAALGASAASAQGSVSVQGFGYPGGQLSTRALATGGALADFDAQSPLNPAALGSGLRASVYLQYEPEFRVSKAGGFSSHATTARFPLFSISAAYQQATFGIAYSNFLDRTWSNTYADTVVVGGERLSSQVAAASNGGIADIRGTFAWAFSPRFVAGVALHGFSGNNTTAIGRQFDDSLHIGGFSQSGLISYGGLGASFGLVATPFEHMNLAASVRLGGRLDVRQSDSTVLGKATVPLRYGASFAYDGIPGSTFAVRWSRERWSDLTGLGTSSVGIQDASELSLGAEVAGPKMNGSDIGIRVGTRTRDLPFALRGNPVKETSYSGGLGIPVARSSVLDLGLTRAQRTVKGADEAAWIVSVGLSIRP